MNTLALKTRSSFLPQDAVDRLNRNYIGFNDLWSAMGQLQTNENTGYPPYNVYEVNENNYEVELAVAGLNPSDISIVQERTKLIISSTGSTKPEDGRKLLHQGIANRKFERVFNLQEYVKVVSADYENGVLVIKLEREVPEKDKPRTIEITQYK